MRTIQHKIAAARHTQMFVNVLTGACAFVGATLLLLGVEMTADWWWDFTWAARLLVALVILGALGFIGWRMLVLPILVPPDDDTLALRLEHIAPQLRSRLISAVQLTREARVQSPSLLAQLVAETETMSKTVPFHKAVRWSRLLLLFAAAAMLSVGAVVAFWKTKPSSVDLLRRAFLFSVPVPRKTSVVCVTKNQIIAKGDSVTIEALANGVAPTDGRVTLRFSPVQSQTLTLLPTREDRARFRRKMENVQESFSYQVKLNDGVSESYRVEAQPRPALATLRCLQVYPGYTGLGQTRRALGDLALLQGSKLELTATPTKPLKRATIRLAGLNREQPMQASGKDFTGAITIPTNTLTGFSIALVDTAGVASKDDTVYRIDIVPDKPPTVNITYPTRREELITVYGTLWVGFEASDDFGIASAFIHYKLGDATEEKVIELEMEGQHPKTMRRRYEWKMSAVSPLLVEGTTIEFWIEARDINNVTGPGITMTDHYAIKVVSEADKRAELMTRLDEYLNQLGGVADSQLKLNQALGEIIRSKPQR